jgi:rhamnulokinase
MWTLKQCMDGWSAQGRPWTIEDLVSQAAAIQTPPAAIDINAEPLLLDGEMPKHINCELQARGQPLIPEVAGNEPLFARLIFESLASRYATALAQLEQMLGRKLEAIHILGGGSRNKLLTELTALRTGLPVESGQPESSTIGNLAVQLAASDAHAQPLAPEAIRRWAALLCQIPQ